mmetsp:Transcript_9037/g.26993  ORF Transcript_9037/g.26993 Transcript_9037/m.26993 type:complete len:107 (-) Transcript_9037:564-884(-)
MPKQLQNILFYFPQTEIPEATAEIDPPSSRTQKKKCLHRPQDLTLMLNEHAAMFFPSAKKSQLTTAAIPRFDSAPRINPHGNASILMAATLAVSSSGGRRLSHLNS